MALSFKEKQDIRKQISTYLEQLDAGNLPFKEKNEIRKSVAELLAKLEVVIDARPEIQNEKLKALIDGRFNNEPPEAFLKILKDIVDEIGDIEPIKPPTISYVKANAEKTSMVLEAVRQLGLEDIAEQIQARSGHLSFWSETIQAAKSFMDIASVFRNIFHLNSSQIPGQRTPETPTSYKDDGSDFGLKVQGIRAREEINSKAKDILSRVQRSEDLTDSDREILKQYSGKGGLTQNSQFEYYTPTPVAEGLWGALAVNGYANGNVLEPSTGAGVFSATKPMGTLITGAEIDPVASRVNQLLHPEDMILSQSFEKLAVDVPDGAYDAAIGNVPFGDARGPSAHDDPAYKSEKRIERYFLLRAIDKIRPGGLACFVVPINIVGAKGKKWEQFRIQISKKAEFLGAHKLPSKTFSAQGTDTVVDVVVFRKHPEDLLEKVNDLPFEALEKSRVIFSEFIEGRYWQGEGRSFIMGHYVPKVQGERWSRERVDGDIDAETLKRNLAKRFSSRIDWAMIEAAEPVAKSYIEGDRKVINGREYEMRDGAWEAVLETVSTVTVIDSAKFGAASLEELRARLESHNTILSLTSDQVLSVYKTYPELLKPYQRDAIEFAASQPNPVYHEQVFRGGIIGSMIARYQNQQGSETEAGMDESFELSALQELVAAEIQKYGHPKNNKALLLTGESSRAFGLFANAMDEKGNFSDLLSGTLQQADRALQFDSTNIQSIVEHLFFREGVQAIELDDLRRLYTGKRELNSLGDVAELEPNTAVTPDGMIVPMSRYVCGDIVPKLQALTSALGIETDDRLKAKYQSQIDEINRRRIRVGADAISFGMQQKWFSRKYLVEFLRESGYPNIKYGREEWVEEEDYSGKTVKKKDIVEDYEDPFGSFFGTGREQGFDKQLLDYLNGGKVTSSKAEILQAYKDQVKTLEENFNVYMQQHDDADLLTEQYNLKFNGFTPFEYEGGGLDLPDVSGRVKLHDFQNAAIRRSSEEGRGCLAFDVGLGKTYTALGLVSYNKKMGRSRKTCITVPKAVLANWYHEAKKFYGNLDDALFVGFEPKRDKNGSIIQEPMLDETGQAKTNPLTGEIEYQDALVQDSPQEIFEKMWKIPQTNLSLVIMTKEKYGAIPMRPATKDRYAQKMLERQLISDRDALVSVTGDDKASLGKGKEKLSYSEAVQQDRYRQQFSDEGTEKKGEFPYFEDMGFDSVIVDEAHEFKNSYQGGKETGNIAYLPTAPSAKRAIDMNMKMHYLREQNSGRGSYLLTATPVTNSPFEIFNMLSLVCPVEEFERFGVYTVDDFIRVFGNIQTVQKTRVSGEVVDTDGLIGLKNLDGLRNLFHKYVNMKNAEDVQLPLPPHTEVHEDVEMSPIQEELYASLREAAKEAAKPRSKISMFSIIRDMDRVTTDLDLYNRTMTFVFREADKPKVDELLKALPATVQAEKEDEDGKAVKMDISLRIERKDGGGSYVIVVPEQYEEMVVTRLKQFGIDPSSVAHPVMPKYARLIENSKKELEAGGKQIVFTEEKSQHAKVKRILVHHLPLVEDQILVINADTADGDKLQQISDAYNSGKARIVIANKKAEVGVNLHKGTSAIHHLTLPWAPASIQQRNGRGVRQGNRAEHINIYYYLGKGSFDEFRLDLLKSKSNWMRDLFFGKGSTAENANAFNQDDYLDLLEADPEEAKRKRLAKLEAKKAEEKARQDKLLINTLQQLASAAGALARIDANKEAESSSIDRKVAELRREIENTSYLKSKAVTEEEQAKWQKKVEKAEAHAKSLEARKAKLNEKYEAKRLELEARVKQKSGFLRGRAKSEGLPFDERLIDHPEDCLVTMDGRVIAVRNCYELKEDCRASSGGLIGRSGTIFIISAVNPTERLIQVESIVGTVHFPKSQKDYQWIDSAMLPRLGMVQVSYSEKEINAKKLLSREWNFRDLANGTLDRETFLENLGDVKLNEYDTYIFRNPESGKIEFRELHGANIQNIVYPDPQSEDFRKSVCTAYLELKRSESTNYYINQIMALLFGDYKAVATEYGVIATESEIRSAIAQVWEEFKRERSGLSASELLSDLSRTRISVSMGMRAKELGDNPDEQINNLVVDYITALMDDLHEKVRIEKEEAERIAQEALRSNPNYKEIPADIAEAFKKIGLTVKYNTARIALAGFRGRRGDVFGPFERLFLQDDRGKNGTLYRMKDILKARYRAQFSSDPCDGFRGAWWHVPASVDVKELYRLLA